MIQFSIARIGTSEAAKRVDTIAQAFQRQREVERRPVAIVAEAEVSPEAPRESPRQWAARQVVAWAERQPHIVATFAPRWRLIAEDVAARNGVTAEALIGLSRKADLVAPRFEAMYRIADETSLSLPEIGRRFGGRDHSTVWHAIRTHAARNGLPMPRRDDGEPT